MSHPAPHSPSAVGTEASAASQPDLRLCVVFFALDLVEAPALRVALVNGESTVVARLPSGTAFPLEPLDDAARRIARSETGITEQYLEQLYTISRCVDERWLVIVSSIALAAHSTTFSSQHPHVQWFDVRDVPFVDSIDREVLDYALVRLRAKLGYTTIAFHLLPSTFTMSELQRAYEIILDRPLDKRNFRRRMVASGILEATANVRRAGSHRPAALYRFRSSDDRSDYLTPRQP